MHELKGDLLKLMPWCSFSCSGGPSTQLFSLASNVTIKTKDHTITYTKQIKLAYRYEKGLTYDDFFKAREVLFKESLLGLIFTVNLFSKQFFADKIKEIRGD